MSPMRTRLTAVEVINQSERRYQMKASKKKKTFLPVFATLISLLVLAGCSKRHKLTVEPFSHEGNPQGAEVTMYFNEKGEFFITDCDGKPVKIRPNTFSSLPTIADQSKPGWIKLLGSFTLFQIKKNHSILLCDQELRCLQGSIADKPGQAVLSINYDKDSNRLFIADANGEEVMAAGNYLGAAIAKFSKTDAKSGKASQTMLKSLDDLIEKAEISTTDEIRMLESFIAFKVRGSYLCAIWLPAKRKLIYTCIDANNRICSPNNLGKCPRGNCPP